MEHSTGYERLLREAEAAWQSEKYDSAGELFREAAAQEPEDADAAFFAEAARICRRREERNAAGGRGEPQIT